MRRERLRRLDDAACLARLHAPSFAKPWDAAAFAELLADNVALGCARGFIMLRVVADEAEILTLAVAPPHRRCGLGRALVKRACAWARAAGADALHLEVAENNKEAHALYQSAGFVDTGLRPRYYGKHAARLMRRSLRGGKTKR